jgi:hypothetical protein
MRWQHEVQEILEKANWPPSTARLIESPWPKILGLALLGWVLVEVLARVEDNARARWERASGPS